MTYIDHCEALSIFEINASHKVSVGSCVGQAVTVCCVCAAGGGAVGQRVRLHGAGGVPRARGAGEEEGRGGGGGPAARRRHRRRQPAQRPGGERRAGRLARPVSHMTTL